MRTLPLAVAIGLGLVAVPAVVTATVALQPATGARPMTPAQLLPTPPEIEAIIARYRMDAGYAPDSQLEEIIVTAPAETLPMSDVTRDAWTGLAAPVWALLHPTQGWRIFVPIPVE
jgi:hypothetical protein